MPEPAAESDIEDIDDDVPAWAEYLDQLRADLEAARESNVILDTALQHCCEANQDFERRLDQSRATEAELRARVTDLVRAIRTEHQTSNGSSVYMEGPPQHERSIMRCRHPLCAALDAAEQPSSRARA